jgi:hypothetical protein
MLKIVKAGVEEEQEDVTKFLKTIIAEVGTKAKPMKEKKQFNVFYRHMSILKHFEYLILLATI